MQVGQQLCIRGDELVEFGSCIGGTRRRQLDAGDARLRLAMASIELCCLRSRAKDRLDGCGVENHGEVVGHSIGDARVAGSRDLA